MTPRNLILALDFDGVMHPVNSRTESKFCRLDLLEAWLRGRPSVRVLISSSWRELHSFDELVSFFSMDLQDRIAGVTPQLAAVFGDPDVHRGENVEVVHLRQREIEAWIADCESPVDTWVALDDDASLFAPGWSNLVVCDPGIGLTEQELLELDGLLFDGVWDGDAGMKVRSAKFDEQVRAGTRAPESLSMFSREQVRGATITNASELSRPMYGWGELEARLEAEDMLSAEEASALSGVPAAVLIRWAARGLVLGLEHSQMGLRFAKWQFGKAWVDVLPALFKALDTNDAWAVLRWLEAPLPSLDGKTPGQAIEERESVRALAELTGDRGHL